MFIISGFEETEAVTPVDILRRGGVELKIVSLTNVLEVKGKHKITVTADMFFKDAKKESFDMIIIPGGTTSYLEHKEFMDYVAAYAATGRGLLAAICAAPAVFGVLGLLKGKNATCYPGIETYLEGANYKPTEDVVTDGNITTARGPAFAAAFAVKLLEILKGVSTMQRIKADFLLK